MDLAFGVPIYTSVIGKRWPRKAQKNLHFLGDKLHAPHLWHLNRHSVAMAFAIGLFFAWIPAPAQMAMAAVAAMCFRANLAISVALVWITNPLTMPPMYYFAYRVGLWVLDEPHFNEGSGFSLETVFVSIADIGGPFLFGSLIVGIICSSLGYMGIRTFWRCYTMHRWKARKNRA